MIMDLRMVSLLLLVVVVVFCCYYCSKKKKIGVVMPQNIQKTEFCLVPIAVSIYGEARGVSDLLISC